MTGSPFSTYIIAGEQSGDQLGAHLMSGLKELQPGIRIEGIGGSMMASEGLVSLFDMSDLSVMGIAEVLPRLPKLLRRINETASHIVSTRPDVLVTIDSPDFCLRVARKVKPLLPETRFVHYVAPSVWAWRPHRAKKMARTIDHVLALLPFEPPLMEAEGMTCDFVGHPVATIEQVSSLELRKFRETHNIPSDAKLLCLLPGSRLSEVTRHSPKLFAAAKKLSEQIPDLRIVVPAASSVYREVNVVFAGLTNAIVLEPDKTADAEKFAAFAAADCALAVSGTVSLELAAQETPMVIGYDASLLTRSIMRRAFLLDTVTLVNIVSDSAAVPEFLFEDFTVDNIVRGVVDLLENPKAQASQIEAAKLTMERLGRGGEPAGLRAAKSVLRVTQ